MRPPYPAENRHYFDWAATAVQDDCPCDAVSYGNPSSLHYEGRAARDALEDARARCAAVLSVSPEAVYFTSGGTESNCIPLFSYLARPGGGRILASAGEHSSVSENIRVLERLGKPVGRIPIDSSGRVTEELLSKTLEKYGDARFAAIMAVNNEVGTISDMASLRDVMRKREGPPLHIHCDMVQAAGKIPLDISGWDIDSASFNAHKIGGPRGIGLLYLRRPLEALYSGGGQEHNIRPGTENVAGAVAMAACLENHARPEKLGLEYAASRRRWSRFLGELAKNSRCRLIPLGREIDDRRFSPYIVQAAFKDVPGEVMARALDDMGFAVSTGSACSSDSPERPVLAAMGIEENLSLEGIRISQGWSTTDDEIDLLLAAISEVLQFL
ncbi:MAG: cysteine desulfurase [Treponema sp.]|jgi:cysteine desulfurase|nr:cysteine desulfurase [Treponema sp.]